MVHKRARFRLKAMFLFRFMNEIKLSKLHSRSFSKIVKGKYISRKGGKKEEELDSLEMDIPRNNLLEIKYSLASCSNWIFRLHKSCIRPSSRF